MTTVSPRRLGDALRACARGIHPLEAGTGLLIDCGSWLHREDFTSRFITTGTNISDGTTVLAATLTAGARLASQALQPNTPYRGAARMGTIACWISPVTRASRSSTNTFTSLRTPNSRR